MEEEVEQEDKWKRKWRKEERGSKEEEVEEWRKRRERRNNITHCPYSIHYASRLYNSGYLGSSYQIH